MAFTLANLVKMDAFAGGLNDATTTVDDGFGGTVTRQTEPINFWFYSQNETVANIVTATFAAAGSTTGTGQIKAGDAVCIKGSNTTAWYYVSNAGPGALTAFGS